MSTLPPVLVNHSVTVTPGHSVINLTFNEAIQRGTGTIIVTDGALQTVIDRVTGLPSTRVVGATDTHEISLDKVGIDGSTASISADGLLPNHNYRVFILPGVLQSGGQPFAGVSNGNLLTFSSGSAVDHTAPTVASFTLSGNKVSHSGTVDVTISFSEPIKTLPGTAFTVPNATVSSTFSTTDGGTTWHGTLSTNASTNAVGNVLKLDMSKVQDIAGNAGSGFAQADKTYDVDVTPPTVTMTLSDTHLSATHSAILTMQFSEPVAAPSLGWLTSPNATLGNLTKASSDGSIWTATLIPSSASTSTGNHVTLDMTQVHDLAGNAGTGSTDSPGYDVNGSVSTSLPYVTYMYLGNDTAGFTYYDPDHQTHVAYDPDRMTDFITSDPAVSIHGVLSSELTSGQSLKLTIGTQQISVTPTGQLWSYVSPTLAPGSYNVSVQVVDGTSTGSSASQTLVVDTDAPVATVAATQDVAQSLVVHFSEPVVWQGISTYSESDDGTASITFNDEDNFVKLVHGGNTEYVYIDQNNLSSDGRTLTISANDLHLTSGTSYTLDLAPSPGHDVSSLTDVAGNFVSPHVFNFTTTGSRTDMSAPKVLAAMATRQGEFGIGDTIEIQIKFNEPVTDGGHHAELTLNNGAKAVFDRFSDDGRTAYFKYTVAAGDAVPLGNLLDLNGMGTLATTITDIAGNHLGTSSVQLSTLLSKYAYSDVLIDPVRPATIALAPILDSSTDTGAKGDALTTIIYPSVHGSGATPNTEVVLYDVTSDGQRMLGYGTADGSGNYQIEMSVSPGLLEGVHHLKVGQLSAMLHNPSAALSPALDLTIDDTAPNFLIASLDPSSDGGTLGDWKTAVTTPKLILDGYETGATVVITDGSTSLGTLSVGSDGSVTLPALSTGVHHLTMHQTDVAGNPSGDTSVDLTIDPTAVVVTTLSKLIFFGLTTGTDTGNSHTDGITSNLKPEFTGAAATPFATITMYEGSSSLGTATADASGNWTLTLGANLTPGAHSFTFKQSDSTHTASTASDPLSVTIDTTVATISNLALDSDTGITGDWSTTVTTPKITGTGEVGAKVDVLDGSAVAGTATVLSNGTWSVTLPTLAVGTHPLKVHQTDAAGNLSTDISVNLVIESLTLSKPDAPALASASDSGSSHSDGITNVLKPQFTGNAIAGATIELFDGSSSLGTTTANTQGAWSFTPTANLSEGEHSITVKQSDSSHSASTASDLLKVTIDKTGPILGTASSTAPGGVLDIPFNEVVSHAAFGTVTIYDSHDAVLNTYTGSASNLWTDVTDSSGTYSVLHLPVANDGYVTIVGTATDLAGNQSTIATTTIHFTVAVSSFYAPLPYL